MPSATPRTPLTIDLHEARWVSYSIPGSEPPVQLTRLNVEPDGGYTVVVRFPAGWSRPATGYYDAAEEVLFLAGGFQMSGQAYAAGDAGWFPAHYRRAGTHSPSGALALAWFSGPDGWSEGVSEDADRAQAGVVTQRWTELAVEPTPLGVAGRVLHVAQDRRTWLVDDIPAGIAVPADAAALDLFDLATHRFIHATPGQELPPMPVGPVWVRMISAAG